MLITYLSVEVVIEVVEQFALDGNLVGDETHVVGNLSCDVMMVARPNLSNCGRPARPKI